MASARFPALPARAMRASGGFSIKAEEIAHEVRPFFPCLAQAGNDAAPALRTAVARASVMRRTRLRLRFLRGASLPSRRELDVFSKPLRCGSGRPDAPHAHWADGLRRPSLPS